ncbi:hypothetical protein BK138_22125 [Paenibacillus rhizosphaerae]|uniref:Uncharacterized protein n=1 Tax=Paenibacillus rhizosphaerae TaxID=297318 RepID=A0A1R1ELU0_9BACL|nr:hypothetical protein BK138_22125 [Paenibacillus rhizosphaerae]OXL86061.1 hypothetical protein BCV73_25505 [Paenibacillus sp. SSG-1]
MEASPKKDVSFKEKVSLKRDVSSLYEAIGTDRKNSQDPARNEGAKLLDWLNGPHLSRKGIA